MMTDYEQARSMLKELAAHYRSSKADRNEATTRIQLIDKLLFNCLGWSRDSNVEFEAAENREYADYTLLAPRRVLIVEAKREGIYFELPAGETRSIQNLRTLCRDNDGLKIAIEQAMRYCQNRGVPFGAVANGHQVVAFLSVRIDGVSPLDGKALVFPSFEYMEEHFHDLWQALSRPGVEERNLQNKLLGNNQVNVPTKLSSTIGAYPGLKNRNVFQADLQIVSELVIEDVVKAPELEAQFLSQCYCESGALSQHSLVSKHILEARYSALFDARSGGPALAPAKSREGVAPDLLAKSISRRPILLIGDVGVGKSIFIKHLVKIDAKEAFEKIVSLNIDLGFSANFSATLREFVLQEIFSQLESVHNVSADEATLVRGIYNLELKKFSKGIYGALKDEDPTRYRAEELKFLEAKVSQRDQHLKAVLEHLSKARQKQIVIFIDNCDQRNDDLQQDAFLVAQEIAANWPATIFVSLRPETFHRSLREGALTGYHPKAFTIAPPRVNQVIEKRLTFGLRITSGEIPLMGLSSPIQATFSNLDAVIRSFLFTLNRSQWLHECLDNISGGNVRRALDLVKEFFGSGHVDTEKIARIFAENGRYNIPQHEFLRAVLYGDGEHFNPDQSPLANVFDVSSADPKEHFLVTILLSLLESATGLGVEEGFVESSRLYQDLQGLGFIPDQIDAAILRGHRYKLIETSARRDPNAGREAPPSLRLTTIGAYHIKRLVGTFTYLDAVIVDTPIMDLKIRSQIKDVRMINARLERAKVFKKYLDDQWRAFDERDAWFPWAAVSKEIDAEIVGIAQRIESV